MNYLAAHYGLLEASQVRQMDTGDTFLGSQSISQAYVSLKNEVDKVVVYERAGLLFVFNFHPTKSFTDYRVGVDEAGKYEIVLSSDERRYGGFDNIALDSQFFTTPMEWNARKNWLQVCFYGQESHFYLADFFFCRYTYQLERALYLRQATDRLSMIVVLLKLPNLSSIHQKKSCRETWPPFLYPVPCFIDNLFMKRL